MFRGSCSRSSSLWVYADAEFLILSVRQVYFFLWCFSFSRFSVEKSKMIFVVLVNVHFSWGFSFSFSFGFVEMSILLTCLL